MGAIDIVRPKCPDNTRWPEKSLPEQPVAPDIRLGQHIGGAVNAKVRAVVITVVRVLPQMRASKVAPRSSSRGKRGKSGTQHDGIARPETFDHLLILADDVPSGQWP